MKTTTDHGPNIGHDDHTPALFMHAPREPKRSDGEHGYQLRFGGGGKNSALDRIGDNYSMRAVVYRDSECDIGSLTIAAHVLKCGSSEVEIIMSADDMQTLACALLDAAHHLRTVPGAPYVWLSKADAGEVPA